MAELAPNIQWIQSYVTEDKTFCVYLAQDEEMIREHAKRSGFPATKVTEIRKIFDPTTDKGRVTSYLRARGVNVVCFLSPSRS